MAVKKGSWLRGASVGPHFVIALLIGYYFGYKIDQWAGTEKVWSLVGAAFGLAAGFINLFREVAAINKEEELEREQAETDKKGDPNIS